MCDTFSHLGLKKHYCSGYCFRDAQYCLCQSCFVSSFALQILIADHIKRAVDSDDGNNSYLILSVLFSDFKTFYSLLTRITIYFLSMSTRLSIYFPHIGFWSGNF